MLKANKTVKIDQHGHFQKDFVDMYKKWTIRNKLFNDTKQHPNIRTGLKQD